MTMCHRTQIPTFLDAEPTRARPPDPRGPSTDVLCPSSLGMNEVTGQSQATLKSKSPMQSIDRLTFVFNHPASQPTFFISSCSFFKLRSREQRHRFSWSRFRRRFWQTGPVDLHVGTYMYVYRCVIVKIHVVYYLLHHTVYTYTH